jgi:adenylylsulfate kinase
VAAKSKPQKAKAKAAENIHPHFDAMLPRTEKEKRLGQRGVVCWLYGLSGSGKSTLTLGLERQLFAEGRTVQVLDGDNIRSGLNRDLGFGDLARRENIRRVSEVAKLFAQSGVIVLASFITPRENFRALAREIIGDKDFFSVYVKASVATCTARDPKGLYKKAQAGEVKQFTGVEQAFEEPQLLRPDLIVDTEANNYAACLKLIHTALAKKTRFKK